eukprot:2197585-Prymnesium_polylepis.2
MRIQPFCTSSTRPRLPSLRYATTRASGLGSRRTRINCALTTTSRSAVPIAMIGGKRWTAPCRFPPRGAKKRKFRNRIMCGLLSPRGRRLQN